MKMKKILSGALASAMALSLTATAFADVTPVRPVVETTESSFAVELEGMIYTPTIRVQVTETGSVYVNPSKSVVAGTMTKALDGTIDLDYSFTGKTLISTPILIRSDTENALKVSVSGTAAVPNGSEIKLANARATAEADGKVVFLQVGGSTTPLGDSDALKTVTESDGSKTPGLDATDIATSTSKGLFTITGTDTKNAKLDTAADIAKINAATLNKDATGKVTTAVPQYGVVVVTGDANSKATGWTESDVVNVNLALTFAIDSTT